MKRWILTAMLALSAFTSGCVYRANHYRHGSYSNEYRRGEYRRGDDNRNRGAYGHDGRYRDRDGRYERSR